MWVDEGEGGHPHGMGLEGTHGKHSWAVISPRTWEGWRVGGGAASTAGRLERDGLLCL